MQEISYGEGSCFAVPLRGGGFAVGVIARVTPRREGIPLGYFFGPRRPEVPALGDLGGLSAADAILVRRFVDLGLVEGTWPLIGRIKGWDRHDWPTPAFGRFEELSGRGFKVIYDDSDPSEVVREEQIAPHELADLPSDGVSGDKALEVILTGLLR